MTRKDNYFDNAMGKRLFSRFKAELLQNEASLTFEYAFSKTYKYFKTYYNRKRRHSGINYEIRDMFEEKFEKEQLKSVLNFNFVLEKN